MNLLHLTLNVRITSTKLFIYIFSDHPITHSILNTYFRHSNFKA